MTTLSAFPTAGSSLSELTVSPLQAEIDRLSGLCNQHELKFRSSKVGAGLAFATISRVRSGVTMLSTPRQPFPSSPSFGP